MKVLLISGWANAAAALEPLADIVGGDVTCVDLVELEALGAEHPAGVSAYAAGLLQLLGQSDRPCVVGGWSMGGLVAQEAFKVSPQLFAGLVFMGSTPKFCADDAFLFGSPTAALDEMKGMIRQAPSKVLTAFYAECSGHAAGQEMWRDLFVTAASNQGAEALGRGLDYLRDSDFRAAVPSCPVLVIHGSRDLVIPAKAGRALAKLYDAEYVSIKGGHHDLVLSSTEQLGERIIDFLTEKF